MAQKPKLTLDEAIALVALNDEPGEMRAEEIKGYMSVVVVADIYGLTALGVARKIAAYRRKEAGGI